MTRLADVWRTKTVHSPSCVSASETAAATIEVISVSPCPRVWTESCLIMVNARAADDHLALRSARLKVGSVADHLEPRRHQHHAAEPATHAADTRRRDHQ